jgi:CheY-like chemotaxis protein
VEDEPAVRAVTRQTLEQFGYKVLVASDGAEAVSVFAQNTGKIDMVFTDMMMPVMDGLATIHVLRRMDPHVRILAASGLSLDGAAVKEVSSAIRHFLPKPYPADVLLSAVAKVLKGSGEIRDHAPEVR